jgi:RNA polymerase sigma factor (sigma-70 family)
LFLKRPTIRKPDEPPRWAELSDADLLQRFVHNNEGRSFEELVTRHGPLVLSVCRRVLRHDQDTEDAFQATFLVLARKAGSIHKRQSLASWLYKVALRIAFRARANRAQRAVREGLLMEEPASRGHAGEFADLGVVDEEVQRLPEKYRVPILLCYLQGRTNEEAARDLRCPTGTVKIRLMRARELLRKRLAKRGLGFGLALLLAYETQPASAAVPATLTADTLAMCLSAAGSQALTGMGISTGVLQLARSWFRQVALAKIKLCCAVLFLLVAAMCTDRLCAWSAEPPSALPAKQSPVAPELDPSHSPGLGGVILSWLGTH